MEEVQPSEDLPPPAANHFIFDGLQTTHVAIHEREGTVKLENLVA